MDNIRKIFDLFLDLVYPPRCIVCNNIFDFGVGEKYLCNKCKNLLKTIELNPEVKSRCKICSRPIESVGICSLCGSKKIFFDKNYSLFIYDEIISELIHRFKFKNHPYIGHGLSRIIADKTNFDFIMDRKYDYIIPVPIHRLRKNHRGFNQSEILARDVSRKIMIPVNNNILLRVKNTKPQWHLNSHERENNLLNAFSVVDKKHLEHKNIILIDDIFTTGSTINKCSEVLKAAGVRYVFSLTLSITVRKFSLPNRNTDEKLISLKPLI